MLNTNSNKQAVKSRLPAPISRWYSTQIARPRSSAGKTISLVFALLITQSSFFATAQTRPLQQWDARFGGSAIDELHSVQQTTDGGYILGGTSYSGISGDKTQASQGGTDYWIVKTDASGVKQWDARFGGSSDDYLASLKQTVDGGYILGGYSWSGISGDKTQANQGDIDYWIVKTDANGTKQWDTRFGGSGTDVLKCLQQTADGGYILGGWSFSGISGDKTQANQGGGDYWIVKTDANGVKQWDARFGGDTYDFLYSLQQAADGGYILGGYSFSGISGDKTQASQGGYDYWIVKTDANGVKQWDARFGGSNTDNLYSLQQTDDGGYILGGNSFSGISGDKTQESQGSWDYWIVKTDANGVKQWDARFGGSDFEILYSLEQTEDGGYILGGVSASGKTGDKTQGSRGSGDYWIVKTDANGVKPWDERFGGSSQDDLYSLQQTADGGYILGGYSLSGISGDKTQASQGSYDYWIVKVAADCNGGFTFYADEDGDGYGNIANSSFVVDCIVPSGYVYDSTDCNDNDPNNHQATTLYADADGDGYGDPTAILIECGTQLGYVSNNTDCDDANASIYPGAEEVLNGIDDNCNGLIDEQNLWIQQTNFDGTARTLAVGFSIGSKGYIGTGDDGSYVKKKDFWEYDLATNVWTQKADFAGTPRESAVGFSIGSKGYIGTGYEGGGYHSQNYENDFWEYDPITNAWTQKADFGGTARYRAVGFSIGSKGYIGTGQGGGWKKDFWEYDPAINIWTQKTDFGGTARERAVGFSIGTKGYLGTGWDGSYKKDFWEYDPSMNVWTQKAYFGGTARYYAVGLSIGSKKGYIGTGYDGSYKNDFWEYDPSTNAWIQQADFGGTARREAVGFSIGSTGYIGTGFKDNNLNNDFWEYIPATSDTSTCAVPINLSVTSITSSSAKLKWDAVPGAEGYKIRYKASGTNSWTIKHSTRKSKDLHNLSPNTTYTWQVKTFCSSNPGVSSDWSEKQHFTTETLRIGDESVEQTSFQIYPNPTAGIFTLDLKLNSDQNTEAVIQVLNMTGQVVYDKTTTVVNGVLQKEIQLPDAAANGTYLVKVTVSDRVYSTQINYQK